VLRRLLVFELQNLGLARVFATRAELARALSWEDGMPGYDQSLADLLRGTLTDVQDLVRGEVALAKAELRQEARKVGAGAAALAAAGVAALIAVVFLLTALAWGLTAALEWPVWTGFALVGGVLLVVALVLATMGRKRFNGEPRMPLTTESMRETMQWTRARKA
jgi:peptidoglycan/LPS O-acetylase OafA/YrhL